LDTNIYSLIPDIYRTIKEKKGRFDDILTREFSSEVARRVQDNLSETTRTPTLRLSQMGPRCPCALWYSIHHPELAEPLPAPAEIKYLYGHVLEALAITLSKAAGHSVTGEQDELVVDGIKGHRDCVIDGCVVDVKSASSLSFNKFKDGSLKDHDDFGYLDQLDGYLVGSMDDPLVTDKEHAYILAIHKEQGHVCLYEHCIREQSIRDRIARYKTIVGASTAPVCECRSVPDGEAGNLKLDTRASYSAYKFCCNPKLRTAIYSGGPRYFTHVGKWPSYKGVPLIEVDRYGKRVYH
jgi:hypothetical protein